MRRILSAKGASGVFLAAPRRTGKSTFIREDLVPALQAQHAEVIYVDLWADRSADPGELIGSAIQRHLLSRESRLLQWARKGGLDKIAVGGLQLDIQKVGVGRGTTLAEGLSALSDATQALIVLVIDEAQHALTTEAGASALFALKAARDQINSSAHHGFRLVATGSNRDKLALLVHGKDQAFLNASLVDMPLLDDAYLAWELQQFDGEILPSLSALHDAFAICGHRPETLRRVLDELAFVPDLDASRADALLLQQTRAALEEARREFMRQVNSLPPLQAAVLQTMAEAGDQYAPFRTPTLARYQAVCAQLSTEEIRIDNSAIQYALDALRDKALVWKSARGVYAIEDGQHAAWLVNGADAEVRSRSIQLQPTTDTAPNVRSRIR